MITILCGMELIKSNYLTIERKEIKRKHRRKRIQKKWIKRYGYIYSSVPNPDVFVFQNKIIGHEETLKKWVALIEKEGALDLNGARERGNNNA